MKTIHPLTRIAQRLLLLCLPVLGGLAVGAELRLNQGRYGHAAEAVGGVVYVLGGDTVDGATGSVERIPADHSKVEKLRVKITPRYWLGAETDGETIYLAGGRDDKKTLDVFESWTPGDRKPRKLTPMPEARSRFDLVRIDRKLYAAGGTDVKNVRSKRLDIYDITTGSWTRGADLPLAREGDAIAVDGKLLLPGGYDGTASISTVLSYDPATDRWSRLKSLPLPQSAQSLALVDGSVYAFGHYNAPVRTTVLDAGADTWKIVDLPILGARHSDAVFAGGEILLVGGCTSTTELDPAVLGRVQRFTAAQLRAAPRRAPLPAERELAVKLDKVPVALDAALEELALLWEERLLGSQTIELSRTYRHGGPSMKDGEAAPPETLVFSQKSGVLHIEIRGQIFDYDGKILKLDKGNGAARVEVPAESAAVALVRAGIALRQLGPDLAARVVRDPKASLRGAMSKGSWRRMPDETLGGVQCWVLRREAGAANWPEETLWIRSDNGLVQRRVTRLSRPVTDGAPAVVFDEEWTLELPAAGK